MRLALFQLSKATRGNSTLDPWLPSGSQALQHAANALHSLVSWCCHNELRTIRPAASTPLRMVTSQVVCKVSNRTPPSRRFHIIALPPVGACSTLCATCTGAPVAAAVLAATPGALTNTMRRRRLRSRRPAVQARVAKSRRVSMSSSLIAHRLSAHQFALADCLGSVQAAGTSPAHVEHLSCSVRCVEATQRHPWEQLTQDAPQGQHPA